MTKRSQDVTGSEPIPWFGARKLAKALQEEVLSLRAKLVDAQTREVDSRQRLERLGALSLAQRDEEKALLEVQIQQLSTHLRAERDAALAELEVLNEKVSSAKRSLVVFDEVAMLQEAGVYAYSHPLADAVAYAAKLARIEATIKEMNKKDGGAILATTAWTVNGSASQGKAMVRDISKLMLRAFNAEADSLVRGLKPYKLAGAIDRLGKVSETIEKLGKSMSIRVAPGYYNVRVEELKLTADFLQKQAEEKEIERQERERMREEKKVQLEIERARAKLTKERSHFENALKALLEKGDTEGVARLQEQLADVDRAIKDVDYRAANIRAGYVYVISNIGSFGPNLVKVGMTRRLEPMDRIKELSDASVPFNFDVHALFFSKDAVGIETEMHARLSKSRVNLVNQRREFFKVTPAEAKVHLGELAGEILMFHEEPEALEYRQSLSSAESTG